MAGAFAVVAAAAALVAGCALSRAAVRPQPTLAGELATSPADGLWTLPTEELGTQRIVRLRYDGPGDDGTLYLTLRLERADRYMLEAHARLLGKSVFRLMVQDDQAVFVDLQRLEYCRFDRAIEISAVPLGPLPFDVLPALLLGRVPARPDAGGAGLDERGDWTFTDDQGRRWTASQVDGVLQRWTLWKAETPAVWWSREGDMSYLSAREEELQLRWRAGTPEPLARALEPPRIPEGFVAGTDCG